MPKDNLIEVIGLSELQRKYNMNAFNAMKLQEDLKKIFNAHFLSLLPEKNIKPMSSEFCEDSPEWNQMQGWDRAIDQIRERIGGKDGNERVG